MNKLFSQLLSAYALYTLTGAGVTVIFVFGAAWFIWAIYGWIALAAFVVALWLLFEWVCKAIVEWQLREAPHLWGRPSKPSEPEPKPPAKPRDTRHGY